LGVPLALLPYPVALIVWSAIGAALFMVAARPWLPRGFPVWLASLTPAALLNFYTGQYGLLVGALWLMTFDKLGRRDGQAGITAGLLTIKPHLGVILGLVLLRRPHAILAACAVCAVLIGLSELAFPGLSRDYFVNCPTAHAHL